MKKAIIAIMALTIIASCHANFDKAHSGMPYKIFPGKGGMKLSTAKYVKLNIMYLVSNKGKDSVLNSSFGKMPQYQPIDTGAQVAYSFMEILPKCSVGDSVEFSLSADTLRKKNVNLPTEVFPKGSFIKGRIKILDAFATRDAIMADINKEQAKVRQKEVSGIEDYIAKKHWNAQKTPNGAYVVIESQGTGPKAENGKIVNVLYKGYLMNGDVFDTNMDDSKGHASPEGYPVKLGAHGVVQGWEEGLPFFNKGGKGKIIVPSDLGYGPQGSGPIPGGASLVFDIQIVDVKDAPAQPAAPAVPQQQPQHK